MKRNSEVVGNLPELKRSNIDQVYQTCIDGCNSHIDEIKKSWGACNSPDATPVQMAASYSAGLENLFSLSEVIGFASGIYYTCGGNLDRDLVRLDIRGPSWPNPPKGSPHTDIDSIGERWIALCDRILTGSEHIGAADSPSVCEKSDVDEKAESWPKFKDKGRTAAASILSAGISARIGEIRPTYSKIKELEKIEASGKPAPESRKLTREEIASMFRSLCLLRNMVGLVNGIAYSTPALCTDLKIVFPVPNKEPIVIGFPEFSEKFSELTSGANYYGRVTKAVISLMIAYKSRPKKKKAK